MTETNNQIYGSRWIVLLLFMFVNITMQILWISYASITIEAAASLDLVKDDYTNVTDMIIKKYDSSNKTPTGFPLLDKDILNGDGYGIEDARPSIELVHQIRNAKPKLTNSNRAHLYLEDKQKYKVYKKDRGKISTI